MSAKTKKSVSRLVGIWTFLLLLIFKGIFPKAALALSSLDACAANPECAAAVLPELAPAVTAPTGAGYGASTLSTTTSGGGISGLVKAVAPVAVVTVGGYGIWHYWGQAQNEQAQSKARQKYCAAHPTDAVCSIDYYSAKASWGWAFPPNYPVYSPGGKPKSVWYQDHYYLSIFSDADRPGVQQWTHCCSYGVPYEVKTIAPEWKDWPQQKRDAAVKLLNNSDWQGFITSMPKGGVLNPGDKINAPIIVIPGQETDDPNTATDERIPRKEPEFFTFPGLPDFDKDGIPDQSDPDDDNDGTPDSSDPQPYNPNVPTASADSSNSGDSGSSSNSGDSGEVTPEDLEDIRDIVNSYKPDENLKCVECADEIEAYLKQKNIRGRRIKLDTTRQVRQDDFIYDDSLPPGAPDGIISENGHHEGIAIRINGEEKVFDNHHPDGVPTQQWINNLTYFGKEYRGDSFRESGYLF